MNTDDLQILALAANVRKRYPTLTTLDLFILGAVAECGPAGLPLAFVRTQPKLFNTMPAFKPAIDRLLAGGHIVREIEAYQATDYKGRAGRAPRREVIFSIKPQPTEYVL